MTRRNRLTSQQAPAHNRSLTADPYLMHQDREPRPAEKYLNGDPDAWAETPMPAPSWPTPRNRVNMPEFADTTFDHKNEQGWGDEDGQDYDNGYTRKPSDEQGSRLARVKSARRRARIALILASHMTGKRASASTLESQAYSLMQLPMRDLVAMFRNLKAEDESDKDEEEAEEEVEEEKEARRRRARLQTELRRIAAEDKDEEEAEEDEDEQEDEEGEKEARRRLARMRRRMAAEDEEEDEVEDEKESRRREARMRKLNTELTRLASMDEDDEEEAEEEAEVEEVEKEARLLEAKARLLKAKAALRKFKATEDESDKDEEEAGEDEEDDEESEKEARRRQARNRKRVADDLMMDEEVEADEEDMSLEDMDQDMGDLMMEADEDPDMDALNALMDEEEADDGESDEFFSDDMGMTPELDLLGLDVEEPVIVAKKSRQASAQQVAPKRGVRSVGVRTAAQTTNPGKGGDAQLLSKLWDASPDVSAVFSRPKT